MMTKLMVLIFCLLLVHGNCSNFTGNYTENDKTIIRNTITAAENKSPFLVDIAVFVSDALEKVWGNTYNVHVYGSNIQDSFSYIRHAYLNHYLNWEYYGKYNYTYMIWKDEKCKRKLLHTHSNLHEYISFGSSMTSTYQGKVLALVDSAMVYHGDNLYLNAQYIATKLSPGNWSVLITTPNVPMAYCECRVAQYWAQLTDYGYLKWTYYIVRSD